MHSRTWRSYLYSWLEREDTSKGMLHWQHRYLKYQVAAASSEASLTYPCFSLIRHGTAKYMYNKIQILTWYHSLWLDFSYFFATDQLPLFVKCCIHICYQQSLASIEFSSITRMQQECVCYPTVLGRAYNTFQWDWWCVLARSRWVLACSTSYLPTMNMYCRPTETYLVKGFTHGGMKSYLVSPLVLVMGWNSSEEPKLLPLSVSASVLNSFIKSIPTPTLLLLPFWELTWVPPNLTSGEDWDDECSLSPSETESRVELLTLGLLLVLVAGCWSGNTAKGSDILVAAPPITIGCPLVVYPSSTTSLIFRTIVMSYQSFLEC